MKILFIGDSSSYARAKQRYLVMKDLGHDLKILSWVFPETNLDFNYKPSLWTRIRRKLGYPSDPVGLNQSLLPTIASYQPDLIWVEKANTIWYKTYQQIKFQFPKLKIVYYSEDDIYVPNNRSIYLRKSLPLFDVVYTTKPRNLKELPSLGVKKLVCIYQAFDRNVHRPIEVSPEEQVIWGADVGFVGTFERDRAEKMLFLAQQGIKVRIWGLNWQSWQQKHPNLIVEGKAVYNEDFIKVICSTRINLNFLRKMNRDLHTSRSLEIPAAQGFMLAERTEEHQHLFVEGKEAEYFDSAEELLAKVKYYLNHEEKRQKIAQAGRDRCLNSGYSHHDRLEEMLKFIPEKEFKSASCQEISSIDSIF
jgi:spore maturation protein CgeB